MIDISPVDAAALRLEAVFRDIAATRMADVPILNRKLEVEAVGFRAWRGDTIGVLITPWFMNLICLPSAAVDWAVGASGTRQVLELPSGNYEFLTASEESIGPYLSSSLFSPMFDFPDQANAREVALAVLEELFDPARPAPSDRAGKPPDGLQRETRGPREPARISERPSAQGKTLMRKVP